MKTPSPKNIVALSARKHRKEFYEELHLDQSRKLCDSSDRFTAETSAAVGKSERIRMAERELGLLGVEAGRLNRRSPF